MTRPERDNDRFIAEHGQRIALQVPETHVQRIIEAVLAIDALAYGDYDRVTFTTAPGTQHFRSLGTGRNAATARSVEVRCVELSLFLADDAARTVGALKAIYAAHPYEEPVIFVTPCIRTLHIRGTDEDNPNRFWNGDPEDWVPDAHR